MPLLLWNSVNANLLLTKKNTIRRKEGSPFFVVAEPQFGGKSKTDFHDVHDFPA